jgi:hypothetical protein
MTGTDFDSRAHDLTSGGHDSSSMLETQLPLCKHEQLGCLEG